MFQSPKKSHSHSHTRELEHLFYALIQRGTCDGIRLSRCYGGFVTTGLAKKYVNMYILLDVARGSSTQFD